MAVQPDKAMMILANAVAEVVGANSRAYQQIVVAAGSADRRDHVQARTTFDTLPGPQRRAVKGKAETTATALRQQAVLRRVLRNLPSWRPDNVEWVWPRGGGPDGSAANRK